MEKREQGPQPDDWKALSSEDQEYMSGDMQEQTLDTKEKSKQKKLTASQQKKRFLEDASTGNHECCVRDIKEGVDINTFEKAMPYTIAFEHFYKSISLVNEEKMKQIQWWLDQGSWVDNSYVHSQGRRLSENEWVVNEGSKWFKAWNARSAEDRSRLMNTAVERMIIKTVDQIIRGVGIDSQTLQGWEDALESWQKNGPSREGLSVKEQEAWDVYWLMEYGKHLEQNGQILKDQALKFFNMNPWIEHVPAYRSWFNWSFEWEKKCSLMNDIEMMIRRDVNLFSSYQEIFKDKCLVVERECQEKPWEKPWFWVEGACENQGDWTRMAEFKKVWRWTGGDIMSFFNEAFKKDKRASEGMLGDFDNEAGQDMLGSWVMEALDQGVSIHHDVKNFLLKTSLKQDKVELLKTWIEKLGVPKDWVMVSQSRYQDEWKQEHWVEIAIDCHAKNCLKWLKNLPSFKATQDYYKTHALNFSWKDWKDLLMFHEMGFDITKTKDERGNFWLASWINSDSNGPRSGYASVIRVHPQLLDQGGAGGKSLNELIDEQRWWSEEARQELKKSLAYQTQNHLKKEIKPSKTKEEEVKPKVKRL